MRFLVDADMPRSSAVLLRDLGHDVVDVRDIGLRSADDSVIFRRAQEEERIIVTADLGFADIRLYPPRSYAGMVVLRLPSHFTAVQINRTLERFAQSVTLEAIQGALVIVEAGRMRIRR